MPLSRRLFFATADATAETVFTNTTSQQTTLESLTMAQGSTGLATEIRLSIGADGATTRVIQYPIPAGTGFYVVYPNVKLTGTETFQLSSNAADDVVVCTGNGYSEVIS
jgi:hypothetical protein